MTLASGQTWYGMIVTKDATGALAAAAAGPVGTLYVNGVANAATVTIDGENPYSWAVTLPALTAGVSVSMYVTATIGAIETASVVAEDVIDNPVTVTTNNDKTGYELATGAVNANALASDAAAEIADAVWDESLTGHLNSGSSGKALSDSGAAGDPWAAPVRTLTMSAASIAAMVAGSSITVLRGDTWSISLTSLGNISARSKLWFTLKRNFHEEDSGAVVQIEETLGLARLNGADGTASHGALSVTDETSGALTITLKPAATSQLQPASLRYDIQMLTTTGAVQTLTEGTLIILADVTKAIA